MPYYVRKRYGLLHFLFDLFMSVITGGLWLLYLVFKYMYVRSR
jgi:hypothetical protein